MKSFPCHNDLEDLPIHHLPQLNFAIIIIMYILLQKTPYRVKKGSNSRPLKTGTMKMMKREKVRVKYATSSYPISTPTGKITPSGSFTLIH